MVIAINKIDAPNADVDRAKTQLTEVGLVPEDFGGDQVVVPISALQGTGIDELLENVLLVSDLSEPKANPNRDAVGIVLESASDRHRGVLATLLVQSGTLRQGDAVICGLTSGRIRAMTDHEGNRVKEAGPATPVEVMGLAEVPPAGERFEVRDSEKIAKREAEDRRRELEAGGDEREAVTLDSLFGEIHKGNVKDMNIVLKADVQGSLEPLVETLDNLSVDEVNTKVIHAAVGSINESDVQLAVASTGVIIGFNVQPGNRCQAPRRTGRRRDPRLRRDLRHHRGHRTSRAGSPRARSTRSARTPSSRSARSSASAAATQSPAPTSATAPSPATRAGASSATAR